MPARRRDSASEQQDSLVRPPRHVWGPGVARGRKGGGVRLNTVSSAQTTRQGVCTAHHVNSHPARPAVRGGPTSAPHPYLHTRMSELYPALQTTRTVRVESGQVSGTTAPPHDAGASERVPHPWHVCPPSRCSLPSTTRETKGGTRPPSQKFLRDSGITTLESRTTARPPRLAHLRTCAHG